MNFYFLKLIGLSRTYILQKYGTIAAVSEAFRIITAIYIVSTSKEPLRLSRASAGSSVRQASTVHVSRYLNSCDTTTTTFLTITHV